MSQDTLMMSYLWHGFSTLISIQNATGKMSNTYLWWIIMTVIWCQSARLWKKQWRLIYNLAVTKNSKMKMFTQDESREKQRSPAKTTLIAPELAQKGSLSKPLKPWQGFHCFDEVGTASVRNRSQYMIAEFLNYITEYKILLFMFPAYSTHLTQSLNVEVFQQYKHWHTSGIN